jgi:hypothetical protein
MVRLKSEDKHYPRRLNGIGKPWCLLKSLVAAVALCFAMTLVALPPVAAKGKLKKAVTFRGLDKITARIVTFHAPIDELIKYGSLTIMVRSCRKAPPEDTPEVAAFIEVDDQRPGMQDPKRLFTGWMFASSPALSALEHPIYDVWVTDCSRISADKILLPHRKSAK